MGIFTLSQNILDSNNIGILMMKKSFIIVAGVSDAVDRIIEWIDDNLDDPDFDTNLEDIKDEYIELQIEEDGLDIDKVKDRWTGIVDKKINEYLSKIEVIDEEDVVVDNGEVEKLDIIKSPKAKDLLSIIQQAAADRVLLWLKYRDRFGNVTSRKMEPWETRDIYLFTHDPAYQTDSTSYKKYPRSSDIGTRQLILASILEVALTDSPYENSERWEMRIRL